MGKRTYSKRNCRKIKDFFPDTDIRTLSKHHYKDIKI